MIEYKGHTIRIKQDFDTQDPLAEFDVASQFWFFHGHYNLGSQKPVGERDFAEWSEVEAYIRREFKPVAMFPVSMLDHSGLWLRRGIGFAEDLGGWDSGQIGFAFISRQTVLKEYSCRRIGKRIQARAANLLQAEFEMYAKYVEGDVWGYVVAGPACNDSCWGFYGYDYCLKEAEQAIDYALENDPEWLALAEATVGPVGYAYV